MTPSSPDLAAASHLSHLTVWEADQAMQKVGKRALARAHGVVVISSKRQNLSSAKQLADDDAMTMAAMQAAPDGALQLLKQATPAKIFLDTANNIESVSMLNCHQC